MPVRIRGQWKISELTLSPRLYKKPLITVITVIGVSRALYATDTKQLPCEGWWSKNNVSKLNLSNTRTYRTSAQWLDRKLHY